MGFGFYQIWSGAGRATRFIEIGLDYIRLKRNAVLPIRQMQKDEIKNIEFLPLNVVFFMETGKRVILRFGTIYHETNEKIIDELIRFANHNMIPFEVIEEKI